VDPALAFATVSHERRSGIGRAGPTRSGTAFSLSGLTFPERAACPDDGKLPSQAKCEFARLKQEFPRHRFTSTV